MSEYTKETLQSAIDNLEKMKDNTYSMAVEFDQEKISTNGSYVAITVNPSGSWSVHSSPSWECSCDEYFSESGVLSLNTIHSETGCFGSPGPEDGYEWEDSEDGEYYGDDSGTWFCFDRAAQELDEMDDFDGDADELTAEEIHAEIVSRGYHRFTVSDRACEPDGYNDLSSILDDAIDKIIDGIQNEIDTIEETESE